ncbi:Hypothetical predicted protein [Paramuricea clavata]|uniref:Uncharacterized protein n=1 Tax=Paramuricea clavata TaxID=317549 RepID=A0A6S7JUL3_PARCT|nr:Hypothetical predicted protein [Paramuricea clavata]
MSKSGSSSNSESETEVFGNIYEDYEEQGELEVENDFQHGGSEADTNNISNFTNVYMDEPFADEIWLNEYLKNKAEEERQMAEYQKRLEGPTPINSWSPRFCCSLFNAWSLHLSAGLFKTRQERKYQKTGAEERYYKIKVNRKHD